MTVPSEKSPAKIIVEDAANIDNVLEVMFEGVYFVDRNRIIRKWNSGASDIAGYASDELLNRCCADNILAHADENGTELCKSGCPLHKTLQNAKSRQVTVYLRHKLGYLCLLWFAPPLSVMPAGPSSARWRGSGRSGRQTLGGPAVWNWSDWPLLT